MARTVAHGGFHPVTDGECYGSPSSPFSLGPGEHYDTVDIGYFGERVVRVSFPSGASANVFDPYYDPPFHELWAEMIPQPTPSPTP
jgi:hypothetical protein